MSNAEEWETSSGLALDGADVTVTALEFGFNSNLGAGVTCANFVFTTDDGEEIEQSFSTGKAFEASRDGSTLEGSGKINKNTNFGLLIESVKDVLDADGLHPADVIGSPRVAENWIGSRWTFGTIEREVRNPTTGEVKPSSKFVVVDFLGNEEDAPKPAKKAAKKAPAKKAPAKKALVADDTDDEGDSEVPDGWDAEQWNELIELARAHDDHGDFTDAALELDWVDGDRVAQKAIMSTRAGSVWASK